jgi:hypothetical protein
MGTVWPFTGLAGNSGHVTFKFTYTRYCRISSTSTNHCADQLTCLKAIFPSAKLHLSTNNPGLLVAEPGI